MGSRNILFVITHPAFLNLMKNPIKELINNHKEIYFNFIIRRKESLEMIFKKEWSEYSIETPILDYPSTIYGKFYSLWKDAIYIAKFIKRNDIKVVIGETPLSTVSAYLGGAKSLFHYDDPEHFLQWGAAVPLATKILISEQIPYRRKNVITYKGVQQAGYLNPHYFEPDIKILEKLNLEKEKYVFIRQIPSKAHGLNYPHNVVQLREFFPVILKSGLKIVIRSENECPSEYKSDQSIVYLRGSVDIYSLMKYARFTISEGDTMARESAVLGTPAIYCGQREMYINRELIEMGAFLKRDTKNEIYDEINHLLKEDIKPLLREKVERAFRERWDNINSLIVKTIVEMV